MQAEILAKMTDAWVLIRQEDNKGAVNWFLSDITTMEQETVDSDTCQEMERAGLIYGVHTSLYRWVYNLTKLGISVAQRSRDHSASPAQSEGDRK